MSMTVIFAQIDVAWAEMTYWDERIIAARKAGDPDGVARADRRCDKAAKRARELEKAASLMPVTTRAEALAALCRVEMELGEHEDELLAQMRLLAGSVRSWMATNSSE